MRWIPLALMLLLAPLSGVGADDAEEATRPNIVFLFSDDHACQAIGAYGSKINETPQIDRLADTGAVFTSSFCTNSICGPSRATVLTGCFSHVNGFYANTQGTSFDGSQPTFPKLLQGAGYQTALVGKWHLGSEPTGFDHWEILPGQGNYYNPDYVTPEGKVRREGYSTVVTTDRALAWLEARDRDKPFLLMCQFKAPHRTWAPSPEQHGLYRDGPIPEPDTLFDNWKGRSKTLAKNAMSIAKHLVYDYDLKVPGEIPFATPYETRLTNPEVRRMSQAQREAWEAAYGAENRAFLADPPTGKDLVRWKYQRYVKDYLRCVAAVDDAVGRVLDYLEANGLRQNTLVMYSSDQGFYLGEHGWYDKRWMFEESMRMPLLVSWPKVAKAGIRPDALVQNIDYAPTFLDAAGVEIPERMQGRSLLPLLQGKEIEDWRRVIYYHYYEDGGEHQVPAHEGVRTAQYKLIHFYRDDGYNLFDIERDPHEMRESYGHPAYRQIGVNLQAELARLRREYGVPPNTPRPDAAEKR